MGIVCVCLGRERLAMTAESPQRETELIKRRRERGRKREGEREKEREKEIGSTLRSSASPRSRLHNPVILLQSHL